MAAIITEKFRLHNAKEFKQSATETGNAMYMFIGRPLSWTDDSNPPTPVDSLNDEYDAYANMTALKKVSATDVSHAIIRRDWTSGTTYDEYRHNYSSSNTANSGATTLWASTYYVVTSDYNVYKCISMYLNLFSYMCICFFQSVGGCFFLDWSACVATTGCI